MLICDLNCDMGEGAGNDALIMPYVTSTNIACGFHAGSGDTIRRTIDLALKSGVKIGAHPSFRDKEHFGRKEIRMSDDKLYAIVLEQLIRIDLIAKEKGASLHHVKPHGAMYNMAAGDAAMAHTIVMAVKDFNEDLVLYGLSGSYLITEAQKAGLKCANEVFADRTYSDDGTLTPRSHPDAIIMDLDISVRQVLQMVKENRVTTLSGKVIPMAADTICIHGDNRQAPLFAKKIHSSLQQNGLAIHKN